MVYRWWQLSALTIYIYFRFYSVTNCLSKKKLLPKIELLKWMTKFFIYLCDCLKTRTWHFAAYRIPQSVDVHAMNADGIFCDRYPLHYTYRHFKFFFKTTCMEFFPCIQCIYYPTNIKPCWWCCLARECWPINKIKITRIQFFPCMQLPFIVLVVDSR